MKKWIILLLIVVVVCFSGCTKDEDVSSLNEYEMVSNRITEEKTSF